MNATAAGAITGRGGGAVALLSPAAGARGGVVRTPFQDSLTSEQVRNNLDNRIPLCREGSPQDIAQAIAALAANDFIAGRTSPSAAA